MNELSREELLAQIADLNRQITEVTEEKADLEIMMETVTEHATYLENQIHQKNKQMQSYIQQVEKLTDAAAAVEKNSFEAGNLKQVAARDDELGHLARVFTQMVQTIKTREQELATAKEQLEAVLNAVPGAISWIDSDGLYIGVNSYLAESCNLSQDAFIGKEVGFLKGRSDFANFMRQFLASTQEYASQIVETSVNDTVKYYLMAAQKYQQGNATVSVGIDVTERKRAEEALRIAEENYRSIFENALEGIFQSSLDGHYISVNPAMARIYGYESPAEMMAEVKEISTQIYVVPNGREEFQKLMEEYGEVKDSVSQVYRKDGSKIWVKENTRAVRDRYGKLLYYEGIVEDVTQRKQEEEALKRQLQELRIEIDQQKRAREVAEITQADYFQDLQAEVGNLDLDQFWEN
ncbi:PAS domain S-box protein [Microseira wollei]|uniref:histidine kinase n=1 Tax=Microseira wollei NIES-4236 TaxID=2530354 RepID=A0AAV3XJS1_9CYAN|nr:PAS domain S-box protein [Microseira wollei]GET40657.1 putative PAS/PAC sensor protein [Microseira wollei NIES-4236]